MKAIRTLLLPILLFVAFGALPAVAQTEDAPADTTTALLNEYELEYELVFDAAKKALTELGYDVNYASKKRNLIETSFKVIADADNFWDVMKAYGEIPFKRSPRWKDGRIKISVRFEELDGKVAVKVSSIISGYEDRFDNAWHYWASNGVVEQETMDAITAAVQAYDIP